MQQTLIKKIALCFVSLLLLVTCASCEASASYKVSDYLNDLAIATGIGNSENIEDNLLALQNWNVIDNKNEYVLEDPLKYECLATTVSKLIEKDGDYLSNLKSLGWIENNIKDNDKVSKDIGKQVIEKVTNYINNKSFENSFTSEYRKNIKTENDDLEIGDIIIKDDEYYKLVDINEEEYIFDDAQFEDVFSYLDISGEFEIDFTNCEVIPYGNEENNLVYENHNYNLLASKTHVFNTDGFRISYSLNSSGIDVHVSKDVNDFNVFLDLSINNVKPSFKWKYEEDDIKNCFFNIKMNSTEKLGISDGKYGNYYLQFKDLDSSSFQSLLSSMVNPIKDQVEASIPICKIKTPIPSIPTAYLEMDLLIKLYASGKAELVLFNSHNMGFETKDGHVRFINEHDHKFDSIVQASSKAGFGVNLALEAASFRLADVELDAGLKAKLQATLHLYDEDGNMKSQQSDVQYSTLRQISKENNDVKVCGDVSFYWYMDLLINTSKTKMSKYGLSKTFHILDEDNQVFGNLHHLENGHFVKKCTRNSRPKIIQMETVKSNKIVLDSYAEVIKVNETYQIIVKSLPENYSNDQLIYSSNNDCTSVINGLIKGLKPGSSQVEVKTNDDKYTAYVNVLVSTG